MTEAAVTGADTGTDEPAGEDAPGTETAEADAAGPVSAALADVRRIEGVERLTLAGLSDDEVTEFVARAAGGDADGAPGELADAMSRLTDGNAFLVCELLRLQIGNGCLDRFVQRPRRQPCLKIGYTSSWCWPVC